MIFAQIKIKASNRGTLFESSNGNAFAPKEQDVYSFSPVSNGRSVGVNQWLPP
jgi:hypothetical protein